MKFQDLVALVGGFVKLITLIFGIVNFYFNYYERDKFIINYFFHSSDNNFLEENNHNNSNNLLNQTLKQKSQFNYQNLKLSKSFEDLKKNPRFDLKCAYNTKNKFITNKNRNQQIKINEIKTNTRQYEKYPIDTELSNNNESSEKNIMVNNIILIFTCRKSHFKKHRNLI